MSRFVKNHAGTLQVFLVIGIVGAALLLSMSMRPDPPSRAPATGSAELAVSVMHPVASPFRPTVRLNGVVQARTVTSIVPQVSGRVIEVAAGFRPGTSVSKGDTLFLIDPSDYELDVERTLAEIEVAPSTVVPVRDAAYSCRCRKYI